jgi:hypothetical protein
MLWLSPLQDGSSSNVKGIPMTARARIMLLAVTAALLLAAALGAGWKWETLLR